MAEKLRVTLPPLFSLFAFPFFLVTRYLSLVSAVSLWVAPLSAVSVATAQADLPVVESLHHVSAAEYTRVIVTLSAESPYNLLMVPADHIHNLPARLVVDFSPARRSPRTPRVLPIQDGLLKQVRTGQFSELTVRIVLEIEQIDDYKIFVLQSPYRLLIDVKGKVPQAAPPPTPVVKEEPSREPLRELPRRYRVMLDPGHGGKDPGALGERGISEKDVVLMISKRLGRKLVERLPVDILFTRTEDVFVPLEERIARANAAKADLFVSIHANASTNPDLQGIETYYLNNTDDRATIRLAALENGVPMEKSGRDIDGAGLSYVLSDLIQTGKEEESIALAHYLQEAVVTRARERYPTVQNLGVKKGPFYVLVGAHMPCVLVETAFISHSVEGKRLMSVEYQETLAEGLFLGIARFLRAEVMTKSL